MTPFVLQIAQILQAFLAPVIAIVVGYIAWQQLQANRRKLVMDRYDRRLRIYEEVRKFVSLVSRDANVSFADLQNFYFSVLEATFLFGPDITAYIDELHSHGADLHFAKEEYCDLTKVPPEGYDHNKVVKTMTAETKWFNEQHKVAVDTFRPYLDISR